MLRHEAACNTHKKPADRISAVSRRSIIYIMSSQLVAPAALSRLRAVASDFPVVSNSLSFLTIVTVEDCKK